ncbi:hypothetical protein HO133_002829 [Letharia lupina]|uniref:Uncharacterized protein n=1 Tax=Letharia lupina TaxID=560253 RepID=A0A8H6CBE0_9LECA|nr:uncharacterized protein HO133_002829 [Letharia lupina]KAF6220397.1 hypothetical protein HO133_002829 [Letharia lupina]
MPGQSALELLSPELQQQILLQIGTLDILYALIRASPRLYQVFRYNKETTLLTIALCQFHPAVQPEAVALAELAQIQHQSKRDTQSQRDTAVSFCDTFPDQIHRWYESNASGSLSTNLCKLDRLVKIFIDDYAQNTLPVLDQLGHSQDCRILPEYNHVQQLHLSTTEIGRLQRAFCRFELYRHLFSRCTQDFSNGVHQCIRDPPLTTAEQAKMFLEDLPAFQISEIACIRDYLFRRLRGIYDRIEDEAVRTLPIEAMTFEESDESAMWESPFYMLTNRAQHEQEEHLEHLMSLGLPYIRQILESTGNEQRDLFLHYVSSSVLHHLEGDFLSGAFERLGLNPDARRDCQRFLDTEKDFSPACDENGYSELPQGWLWAHHHLQPSRLIDPAYKGLRDWGYVFWDYDRLQKSGILRRDSHEVRMIRFSDYVGRFKLSVEQRLHALHPPVTHSGYRSDGQEQSPEDHEEASVSSLDDSIDWDADEVVLVNY